MSDIIDTPVEPVADSVENRVLSPTEQETLDMLYAELKPLAEQAYVQYFLARTPAEFQDEMKSMVEAGLPQPEPPV